jgi:UDP-2,4-diacetamido-2,4,6-trideoxy-beta-L-altropyranose hydrolase
MPHHTLLVRSDASAEIGSGHVMRCIALAQAWQTSGGRVIFALARGMELEGRIIAEGSEVVKIDAEPGTAEDAAQTAVILSRSRACWRVVDGYHFPSDYHKHLRDAAGHLLLMDNGESALPYDCDLVVNPDCDASRSRYGGANKRTTFLLGPRYAPLRREFLESVSDRPEIRETAKRILISFGGGDQNDVTLQVIDALNGIRNLELDLTVVVGASYLYQQGLKAALKESPHRTRLLCNVKNIPELMMAADLAVTAGGGTCYELAFMKVPMFLIVMAHNHEQLAQRLGASAAAYNAGWFSSLSKSALAESLRDVICDQALPMRVVENGARMVDGRGANRIVETMLQFESKKHCEDISVPPDRY